MNLNHHHHDNNYDHQANSDISQLCAENILLWNKFLDAFTLRDVVTVIIIIVIITIIIIIITNDFQVRKHLAMINHRHRLKRFSEGFFTMTNPRKSALCCLDVKHSHHTTVSEATRRSPYFSNLPNLQVFIGNTFSHASQPYLDLTLLVKLPKSRFSPHECSGELQGAGRQF